jgi:hypothetical protein
VRDPGSHRLRVDSAGLTRAAPGAGFSLPRGRPETVGTYVRSTSVSRLRSTPGDVFNEPGEVAGGVAVAIDDQPANQASEGCSARGSLVLSNPQAEQALVDG